MSSRGAGVWAAADKACKALGPDWRLPTDEEWKELASNFGGFYDHESSKKVGEPIKAYQSLIEGGNSGFAALLGGWRLTNGDYVGQGVRCHYWSVSASYESSAWNYEFGSSSKQLGRSNYLKRVGFSVRCLQGAPSNLKDKD